MNRLLQIFVLLILSVSIVNGQDRFEVAKRNSRILIEAKNIPAEEARKITGTYEINAEGRIKMPYLKDELTVAGKTKSQLEALLVREYKSLDIYTDPLFEVTVSLGAPSPDSDFVVVSGALGNKKNVKRNVPFNKGLTLLSAIMEAGDIGDSGSRYIKVTRKGKTDTYDYFSIMDRNTLLQPGDSIVVVQQKSEKRPGRLLP